MNNDNEGPIIYVYSWLVQFFSCVWKLQIVANDTAPDFSKNVSNETFEILNGSMVSDNLSSSEHLKLQDALVDTKISLNATEISLISIF